MDKEKALEQIENILNEIDDGLPDNYDLDAVMEELLKDYDSSEIIECLSDISTDSMDLGILDRFELKDIMDTVMDYFGCNDVMEYVLDNAEASDVFESIEDYYSEYFEDGLIKYFKSKGKKIKIINVKG